MPWRWAAKHVTQSVNKAEAEEEALGPATGESQDCSEGANFSGQWGRDVRLQGKE